MAKRLVGMLIGLVLIALSIIHLFEYKNEHRTVISDVIDKIYYDEVMAVNERPSYTISAQFDDKKGQVEGKMHVIVPNSSTVSWPDVYFNLYPNAFKNWEYLKAAAPKKEGYIKVSHVKINGTSVEPQIDKTLMKLTLPEPLPPQKKASIQMAFTLQLPKGGMRLDYEDNTAFLAQWYPMLASFDEEGWHENPFTTVGDPFYTQMADFKVTFSIPAGYRVISTAKDTQKGTRRSITLSQKNVRDFAAVITKEYKVKSDVVDGTTVNVWYRDSMNDVIDVLHDAAMRGLQFFNEKFGRYPYPEIDVVLGETGHGIAGMEYPGLVTSVDRMSTRDGEEPAIHVIVHELAHQWWYGMVGSNQAKEPWLDEGLTTFSESLYMNEVMGQPVEHFYKQVALSSEQIHEKKGLTVVQSLYDYPEQLYGLMVYARPAAMLWELSDQIGKENVIHILRTYFETYKNRIATTEDFIQVAEQVSGTDLQKFFDKWLYFHTNTS